MDKYHSCSKEDLKLESPFRLLIVGPMNSGKSTFLTNLNPIVPSIHIISEKEERGGC